jgi:hypothetical protein
MPQQLFNRRQFRMGMPVAKLESRNLKGGSIFNWLSRLGLRRFAAGCFGQRQGRVLNLSQDWDRYRNSQSHSRGQHPQAGARSCIQPSVHEKLSSSCVPT